MFEGLFGKKKKEEKGQTEDSSAFMNEGLVALGKLSPEWQKKVMEIMTPVKEKYFKPKKFYPEQGTYDSEYYRIMEDVVYTAALIEEQEREARSRVKKITDEVVRQTRKNIVPVGLAIILGAGLSIRADLMEMENRIFLTDSEAKIYGKIDEKAFGFEKARLVKMGKTAAEMPVIKIEGSLTSPEVSGFEKFDIPDRVVKEIIEKTLPKGITSNARSVKYADRSIPMPEAYGSKVSGVRAAHFSSVDRELLISRGSKGMTEWQFVNSVIIHEFGHASDWSENQSLSIEEKLQLLQDISNRVQAADRYLSVCYVEKIENDDKALEWKYKTIEYFAEIVYAYLSDEYIKLPEADRKIVRDLIKKFDPKFEREVALAKRKAIIDGFMESQFEDK